ncbi:NUDIX hydrolase [Jatrophihabitans sp.]|uniref:NUDIX hydrolase n=1 Tax=Jatrophihabitans sp. TaxID=1932789 RepID=UPI0030C716F9|nr:hydrolase [Jatrophihabitans sp.]
MSEPIRTVGSVEVFASPWMRLRNDEIEYLDGTRSQFAVVERQNFALVVPYSDGGFWLVQQYRYPLGRRTWEFPQGAWPTGHSGTPEELATAELAEETGLRAGSLTHIGQLYASLGYCTQHFDVYLATDLTEGETNLEHTEADMVHEFVPEARLREMVRAGEFPDSHSVAALALLDLAR